MAPDPTNQEQQMAEADSLQFAWEFFTEPNQTGEDDPFYRWLHDENAVRIDWSTFGIEQAKANAALVFKAVAVKMPEIPPLFDPGEN